MRFEALSFGTIRIDGLTHAHEVVIDRGQVRKRSEKPSKKYRDQFGHTHLSTEEEIPWKCWTLVIQPTRLRRVSSALFYRPGHAGRSLSE
jgi:hypothetical protein